MKPNTSRRDFIRNTTLAAGVLTTSAATGLPADRVQPYEDHQEYPRNQPGRGGPVGSATDRGKMVPGLRKPNDPPVPVITPDLRRVSPEIDKGVKVFHLHASTTRRE